VPEQHARATQELRGTRNQFGRSVQAVTPSAKGATLRMT
jgi:hypothetical protein